MIFLVKRPYYWFPLRPSISLVAMRNELWLCCMYLQCCIVICHMHCNRALRFVYLLLFPLCSRCGARYELAEMINM